MTEFQRVHPSTRDILNWSETKAIDSGQPQIDTTHLMHACLMNQDIRGWLRRISVPVESSYLLITLELPQIEEVALSSDADREEVGRLIISELFSPSRKVEGLTDRTARAIKVAGDEMARFGNYYLHPINIFAGVVQADELLTEHVLLGEKLTRTRLIEEIEAEEQRVRLSETLNNIQGYMQSEADFIRKLEVAREIEKLISNL